MRKKRPIINAASVAVGYCRVSTTIQAQEGVSLEAQRERIAVWCHAHGYGLAGIHTDAGFSGKRADNRPGLQSALSVACRQKAALVVYSLSRLARSVPDAYGIAGKLDRAGGSLVLLTEAVDTTTAAGRMFFGMLAVLAAFERDLTAERTAAALAHKRAEGWRVSGFAPFGRRFEDGKVLPNEVELVALLRIRNMRAQGMTLRAIVATLNAEGVPARGKRWYLRSVQLALTTEAA